LESALTLGRHRPRMRATQYTPDIEIGTGLPQ
jgi:hypothetical protein